MAQPDPWTLARDYLEILNAGAERDSRQAALMHNNMMESQIRRQDADLLAQRQSATADTTYGRQLERDAALREHQIGLKRMELSGKGGAGTRLRPVRSGGVVEAGQRPSAGAGNDVASYAYNRYIKQGINPIVAAGIVGNLEVESGWSNDVISGERRGDNGTAAYIAQWRGPRQANLVKFAQDRGHDRPTLDDQLDFIIYEGENGLDGGARQALILASQAATPAEAAEHFMTHYERPNEDPNINHVDTRKAFADAIYQQQGGTGGANTGTQDITAGADPYSISSGGQRRYGVEPTSDPYAMPTVAPDTTIAPGTATQFDPSQVDLDYVWSDADKQSFFGTAELGTIPEGMDIVGPGAYYTGEQMQALGPGAQYLYPIGQQIPGEGAGYVHLAPRGQQPQMSGVPASTSAPIEIQQQQPQLPTAPGMTAPDVAPTQAFPGVGPVGGQRVRQNPNTGGYEMFDGSQWLPLSG